MKFPALKRAVKNRKDIRVISEKIPVRVSSLARTTTQKPVRKVLSPGEMQSIKIKSVCVKVSISEKR